MLRPVLLAIFAFLPTTAANATEAGAVGKETKKTVRFSDGSYEERYPDGLRKRYNSDGSPRGIHRTCSGTFNISCTYWGPNTYRQKP